MTEHRRLWQSSRMPSGLSGSGMWLPLLMGLAATGPTVSHFWPVEGEIPPKAHYHQIADNWPEEQRETGISDLPWHEEAPKPRERFSIPSEVVEQCCQPHEVHFASGQGWEEEAEDCEQPDACAEGAVAPLRNCNPIHVTVPTLGGFFVPSSSTSVITQSIPPCCCDLHHARTGSRPGEIAEAGASTTDAQHLALSTAPAQPQQNRKLPLAHAQPHLGCVHCGGTQNICCGSTELAHVPLEATCPTCDAVAIPSANNRAHCSCVYCGGIKDAACGSEGLAYFPFDAPCTVCPNTIVPVSLSRCHSGCVHSGAEHTPAPLQACTDCTGGQVIRPVARPLPALAAVGPPKDPPPIAQAPKPAITSVAVAADTSNTRTKRRSRSVDARQLRVDPEAQPADQPETLLQPLAPKPQLPQAATPAPPSTPAQPSPPVIAPPTPVASSLTVASEVQRNAARYPLYESQPETFIAKGENEPTASTSQPKANANEPVAESQGYLINFQNLAMTEILKFIGQLTGKNFIYNSDDVQFTVSIVSKEPTTLEHLMAALLQELRIHGLALMEQGNNLVIYKQNTSMGPAGLLKDESHRPQEIGTRVFRLANAGADKLAAIIGRMVSEQALVQVLPETNTLIITDLATNIDRINELIKVLDAPQQTYEIGQYVGINNIINDLIPLAERILEPLSGGKPPLLVPNLNTNSVYIVANHDVLNQALAVFRRLDTREGSTEALTIEELRRRGLEERSPGTGTSDLQGFQSQGTSGPASVGEGAQTRATTLSELRTKFWIHKLQFRQGDQLVDALQRIADSLRLDEKANLDLINAINSVQWLESSNSVVITGTADAVARVKELIEELDVSLRQIFLEMLILDTTVSDSLTYSVDIADRFSSNFVGSAEGFNQPVNVSAPLPTAINAVTLNSGLINANALQATEGFNLGIIGRKIFKGNSAFTSIGALVQALHKDDTDDIILNPKIMVEDGFPAEIFVGQNTAFQTQAIANNNGNILTQNVEFRDVGTTLKVTPQLGNGDIITLLIEQEVSAIVSTQTGSGTGGNSNSGVVQPPVGPTTSKSHTITKVHLPDGYFLILSGVIRDERRKVRRQMPCLGGVPVLGAFVANQANTIEKRNILIFIRPLIIDDDPEYDEITRQQQNIWKEKRKRKPRWKYEADEALEFLNLPPFNECRNPDKAYYY